MTDVVDQVRIKARVTADHKIVADAPEDMAPGDVDIIVERPHRPSIERLKRLLQDIANDDSPGRSRAEIDAELEADRQEWES
jgi:hypothetical protein